MGKDVIDLAVNELRRITLDSVTDKLPMVGADGFTALVQQSAQIAELYGVSEESVIHLLNRHGSLISEVLEIITQNSKMAERIDLSLPYLKAEIEYAASHEGARSVDDVISRRTRIAFESNDHGVGIAAEVAAIIGSVLGWGAKERKASINSYLELVERENMALDELINS
jgi:glycerol-3-phosphate dehydrogenase